MPRKKYKEKFIRVKQNIVNVDNNEENVNEKIILQDDEHYNNIDLDGIDYATWWKKIIILAHTSCIITSEFNQFECVCYIVNFIYLVSFVKYYYVNNH